MGRHFSSIAMNACLSTRNVVVCPLPKMEIDVEKVTSYTVHPMRTQRRAVIVVADGCGDTMTSRLGRRTRVASRSWRMLAPG